MRPAYSIIIFSAASGAGFGLLAALGILASLGLIAPDFRFGVTAFVISFGLIIGGLLSSTTHLGRPERAWRALSQWRTSWLSREGVLALATLMPGGVFAAAWILLEEVWIPAAVASAVLAILTVHATGMIYATLKPIRQWCSHWTVPAYLALGAATGLLLTNAIAQFTDQSSVPLTVVTGTAVAVAWIIKIGYWEHAKRESTETTASAIGVKGPARMLEPPATEPTYLMKEMSFHAIRRKAHRLRQMAHLNGFLVPLMFTFVTLVDAWPIWPLAAVPGAAFGIVAERWLFFAEARHTVTLYHGAESA